MTAILTGKPSLGDLEQEPIEGEYLPPDEGDENQLVEPDETLPGVITGLPWQAAAEQAQPTGLDPDMARYITDNPPWDFHNDHEALGALMPELPDLHPAQDSTHPLSKSKFGKLWQVAGPILGSAAQGALAGSAGGSFGQGFNLAQQSAQRLQELQMRRQAAADLSAWHQAQTERARAETAGIPAKQAALNRYRNARTDYVEQQVQLQAQKLKEKPRDRFIQAYHGQDGFMHLVFQTPSGQSYEKRSEATVFSKPDAQPRPLLGHGPDHSLYLIDPSSGHSRLVVAGRRDKSPRVGTPQQFASVEQWKNRNWAKTQNDLMLSDADKQQRLQEIQNQYERLIATLGGTPAHYDVRSGVQPQLTSGNDSNDPLGLFK